jgi:hypothetical protein
VDISYLDLGVEKRGCAHTLPNDRYRGSRASRQYDEGDAEPAGLSLPYSVVIPSLKHLNMKSPLVIELEPESE